MKSAKELLEICDHRWLEIQDLRRELSVFASVKKWIDWKIVDLPKQQINCRDKFSQVAILNELKKFIESKKGAILIGVPSVDLRALEKRVSFLEKVTIKDDRLARHEKGRANGKSDRH